MPTPPRYIPQGLLRVLHEESREYVAFIHWATSEYDAHTVMNNGTCFFLRIDGSLFGVTAHHVIAQFLRDRVANPTLHLRIANVPIEWDGRQIDADPGLDLVTFHISDAEFAEVAKRALTYTAAEWPPDPPDVGGGVLLTGYANRDRTVLDDKRIEYDCCSNALSVRAVTAQEIELVVDAETPTAGRPISTTPGHDNFGGFSGAPLLAVSSRMDRTFFIAGVLVQSVHLPEAQPPAVSYITRRIALINADGTLWRPAHARSV